MSNMWAGMRPRVPQTPNLTKADIDALTNKWPGDDNCRDGRPKLLFRNTDELRRSLYLAAGLTAEGERKPERVRCWLHEFNGSTIMGVGEKGPIDHGGMGCRYLSGYFVPDGAE